MKVTIYKRGKILWIRGTLEKKQHRFSTSLTDTEENRKWVERNKERLFLQFYKSKKGSLNFCAYGKYILEITDQNRNHFTNKENFAILANLCEFFGRFKITDIKPTIVQEWQNALLKKYSPKTVINQRSVLSQIFKFAVADGHIKANPLTFVRAPKKREREIEIYSLSEFKKLITVAEGKYKNFFQLLFFSGMRIGEALALKWEDIDWENDLIHIKRRVRHGIYDIPKTGKRAIYMFPKAKEALINQKDLGGEEFVFINKDGKPYKNQKSIDRKFKDYLKEAGLKDIRLYDLRHSFITFMLQMGANETWLMQHIGHKNILTTLKFYTGKLKIDENVIKKVNDELKSQNLMP